MSETNTKVPFLPDVISCTIEFEKLSVNPGQEEEREEAVASPSNDSIDQFRLVAQNFVTCMQVLWQYTHEIGSVAERTSLTNLAHLPSLLKDIEKRRKEAIPEEAPFAKIVFSFENEKGERQHKKIPIFDATHANKLAECLTQHNKALRLLHETVLQQMVNAWEQALGDLVAWKLRADPDSIPKDKKLSYSNLLTFSDFDDVRRHLVEEEVADFLKNKATLEQIKYFKDEFNADFRSHFSATDELCEIVLRRHAVVHGGGMASSEYCRRVSKLKNLPIKNIEQGRLLPLETKYIKRAWSIIYSAGVIITHLVAKSHSRSKKSKPDEEASDSFLNNAAFNAIKAKQYEAATIILQYEPGGRPLEYCLNLFQ